MANLVDVDIGGTEFANSTLHITGAATLNGVKANTINSSGGSVVAMKIDNAGIITTHTTGRIMEKGSMMHRPLTASLALMSTAFIGSGILS
tara:strand:+ start:4575 stop:4847 length:273 start_codon:yes stop_codon:yes gene_type:complete